MMSTSNNRPKWWQLYLSLPLLIALSVADSRLKISTRGHQAVQIGIVLFVFGLIYLWLRANASALSQMDQEQDAWQVRVIRVPISKLPDAEAQSSSILELPDSERKGVLSDPFEMDTIDAEFIEQECPNGRVDGAVERPVVSRPFSCK